MGAGQQATTCFRTVGGGGGGITFDVQLRVDMGLGLSDNDPISTWSDQSGNSNHATGSGSTRPLFKATAGPGGGPCVRFDASDDFLNFTNSLGGSSYTIFAVLKLADSNPRTIVGGFGGSLQYRCNSLKQNAVKCDVVDIGSSTTNVSTAAFKQMNMSWDGTTAIFRYDSGADGSVTNAQTLTNPITGIGKNFATGSEKWSGDIVEIAIKLAVMDLADKQTVEAALSSRWSGV